jgi:hypothetical protein
MTTDMSSVFESVDFGRNWSTLDFRRITGGHRSPVRFTADPAVLYSIQVSEELDYGVPVESLDGGGSWSPLPGDPTGGETWTLWADPASSQRLLVSDYETLYLSNDGGDSFTSVYETSDLHVAGVYWSANLVFVAVPDGLLVSSDGGASFALSTVPGLPGDQFPVSFAGASENGQIRLYVVTTDTLWPGVGAADLVWADFGVFRLDWGAASWTAITAGADDGDWGLYQVALSPFDIDTLYLGGGERDRAVPVVLRSRDGGQTWTRVLQTDVNGNVATGWCGDGGDADWTYPEYVLGLAVAPTDPERLLFTDLGFVHLSEDGGDSWRQGYVNPATQNPAAETTPRGRAYVGVGLQQTSAWWLHWSDARTVTAAFTDIRGMRSTDGGRSWVAGSALGFPYNSTYHIVDGGDGTLYAATSSVHDLYQSTYLTDERIDGGSGAVMRSRDDGATWEILHDFGHPVVWLAPDPNQPDTLYASVVHSTDGGIYVTRTASSGSAATWERLAAPPRTQGHPFTVHVLNDGGIVATYSGRRDAQGAFTESSGVFLSQDGGATWQDRSATGMRRWTKDLVLDPHDPSQNTWYVGVYSHWGTENNEVGGLYRTRDRGLSWQRISELYRVDSAAVHPQNPNVLYLTTERQGLWKTSNLGSETPIFTQDPDYPFRQPTRVFFNPYNPSEVWITSFGGGLRSSMSAAALPLAGISVLGSSDVISGDPLGLGLSLSVGQSRGRAADWWLVQSMPSGQWRSYNLGNGAFGAGISPTYTGPLFDLSTFQVNTIAEGTGEHSFYFGVDLLPNGVLDLNPAAVAYDSVQVRVTDGGGGTPGDGESGRITYTLAGRVYRIEATAGAAPEDVSAALESFAPGGGDEMLNSSPDGQWLILHTERFDPQCVGWACLAVVGGDLTTGDILRAPGGMPVRGEGFAAVDNSGTLVVFSAGDGPHVRDLWAVRKLTEGWSDPVLLTGASPYDWNVVPALDETGAHLLFECGDEPYVGHSSCEVGTDGSGFRVVVAAQAPLDATRTPDYAPDGSVVLEVETATEGERIERLTSGAGAPVPVAPSMTNDNSPCVLPDGRIASLWLDRPGGDGMHELKVMSADGSNYYMLLQGVDVADVGLGCGQ